MEKNATGQILHWKKYNASSFDLIKIQRVRFSQRIFSSCQILNKKFYNVSDLNMKIFSFFNLKFQLSPTTCTFHIVFLPITMYSYRLQYLRELDKSTRHLSKNTSFTRFCKELDYSFEHGVPFYSLSGLDICKNLLQPVKIMILILKLLLSHIFLTRYWESFWLNETR